MDSPLLQLPAELRNHIYELVAFDDGDYVRIRRSLDGPSNYAGLTRVHKEMRNEYLRIQRREAMIMVPCDDLQAFLSTFLGPEAEDAVPLTALKIILGQWGVTQWRDMRIDLLTLVRAQHTSRSMTCGFDILETEGPPRDPGKRLPDEATRQCLIQLLLWEAMHCDFGHVLEHGNAKWKRDIANGTIKRLYAKRTYIVMNEEREQLGEYGIRYRYTPDGHMQPLCFKYVRTWTPDDELQAQGKKKVAVMWRKSCK